MANRAVIEIPIDDTAFKKFLELFQNYKDELKKIPEHWQKADEIISGGSRKLTDAVKKTTGVTTEHSVAVRKVAQEIEAATASQKRLRNEVRATDAAFLGLGKSAHGVASKIASITKSVVGWGIAGIGLGSIGALLGIDTLARSALVKQRGALGMNASISEMQAFGVHMQQFAGPGTVQAAANAQINPQQQAWLATLGLNGVATPNLNAPDLVIAEMRAIRGHLQHNFTTANPAYMAAQQLGFSDPEIRNIAKAPDSEFNAAVAGYQRDKNTLGFSPKVAQQWAQLSMTLQRAGLVIEMALIKTLAPLAPRFERMANVVSHWIEQFGDSETVKRWIDNLGSGFDWLASEIKSVPVKEYAGKVGFIVDSLYEFVKWLDEKFGIQNENTKKFQSEMEGEGPPADLKKYLTGDVFNNPGNIRHKGFLGLWQKNFYQSDAEGLRAMDDLLGSKAYQKMTLRALIAKYNGNGPNSNIYAHFVADKTGIPLDTTPDMSSADTRAQIEAAMIQFEGHGKRSAKEIKDELSHYQQQSGSAKPTNYIARPAQVTIYNHTAGRIAYSTNAAAQ
ncbi:MAG: hypothetical protein ACYDBH_01060 [Acidobacteriaceae bacterium]